MKKIIFTLSAIMVLTGISLGQITITQSEMPDSDDTIRTSRATPESIQGYNFASTGTNHIWDFENMEPASQKVDTFVIITSTPVVYYPSFLTKANLALKGESMSVATFNLTNVYNFYQSKPDYYAHVGMAAMLSGAPMPVVFSSPDYRYRFPLNYGDQDTCSFNYNIAIPGIFSMANQSKREVVVDGWGTITTPLGTFQALRIKSILTAKASIHLDTLGFTLPPTTAVTTEYIWLANGYKGPILTATITGGTNPTTTVNYKDIPREIVSSVSDITKIDAVATIYPNPANSNIAVSHPSFASHYSAQFKIIDIAGKNILHGESNISNNSLNIDISLLPAGIYAVEVILPNSVVKSSKVVVH